jgi:DinB superfamily
MTTYEPAIPARLNPFLAQWDYVSEVLFARLDGLTDEELVWAPAAEVWTVRMVDGRPKPDAEVWSPAAGPTPPRTLAWTLGHLGASVAQRADWLVGTHSLRDDDFVWPMTASESVAFARKGLDAWRRGIATMTDEDLDTVGRSAYPGGLDPTLPLIEIVWWVNKELVFHAGEAWIVRDLYAHRR